MNIYTPITPSQSIKVRPYSLLGASCIVKSCSCALSSLESRSGVARSTPGLRRRLRRHAHEAKNCRVHRTGLVRCVGVSCDARCLMNTTSRVLVTTASRLSTSRRYAMPHCRAVYDVLLRTYCWNCVSSCEPTEHARDCLRVSTPWCTSQGCTT